MYDLPAALDTTPLREHGFQHVPRFFTSEALKADFAARAAEIVAARDAGRLTTVDQDAQGFPDAWFDPLLRHPALIALMTELLGPDVCGAQWRILIKDKHHRQAMLIHQDWAYANGGANKVSVFLPLTRAGRANGSLYFIEGSHHYGPVSRGHLDPSRFPPAPHVCPELEVGDIVLCDYLTWHYSLKPETAEERVLLQLTYQPASDASSKHLLAGRMPHEHVLRSRWDAASIPSTDMNAKAARDLFEQGAVDRAKRFAVGLLADDPDNAAAALLLHDIQTAEGDMFGAVDSLLKVQAILARLGGALAARTGGQDGSAAGPAADEEGWRALPVEWKSSVPGYPQGDRLATPPAAYAFGAVTELLPLDALSAIRVRGQALEGVIWFCLVNEAQDALLSDFHRLGDGPVLIAFDPAKGPARLCLRNMEDGSPGLARVDTVEVRAYA
jgi:hypothetical protein